ncbi:MAG TPA: hypothetical protein V6D10_08620 [Trichocoleus sp.]|jgi:hypothetical protein
MKKLLVLLCGAALLTLRFSLPATAQVDVVGYGDGSTTVVDHDNGVAVHEDVDGSITAVDDQGNAVHEDAEGNVTAVTSDGDIVHEDTDGNTTVIMNE